MNYEKVCREFAGDKGIDRDICKLFVLKQNFQIECSTENSTEIKIDWEKIGLELPEIREISRGIEENVVKFLCESEDTVQQRMNLIDSRRNSLAAIGPLIVLWFAGPWSDRKKLRLPCMLVPYIGELLGYGSE